MLILLVSSLLIIIKAGTIQQGLNVFPIVNSVANANVSAQYQFNFITDTYLPAGGMLQIVFPNQYNAQLGISANAVQCSVPCTLNGNTVLFTFPQDLVNGTTQNVFINSVSNPATRGGTGNFILRTLRGINILDENLIFGLIGIADQIVALTYGSVELAATGSYYAGDYTSYVLTFKSTNNIPDGSYMIFTVDGNFTLDPFPACFSPPLNGKIIGGDIFCQLINGTSQIKVQGISGIITALIEYQLQLSVRNPIYPAVTNTFTLGIYRSGTQLMYEQLAGIAGVTIQPAQFKSVSMTPLNPNVINSQSRIMDYVIKFTPTFPIPAGCNIKLVFPAYMQILTNVYYTLSPLPNEYQLLHYVNYGLEDIAYNNIVGIYQSSSIQNYIRITNFAGMTMTNEISVTVRVINVNIQSYNSQLNWVTLHRYRFMCLRIYLSSPLWLRM